MSVYGEQVGETCREWLDAAAGDNEKIVSRAALDAGAELQKCIKYTPDFSRDGYEKHTFKPLFLERTRKARQSVERVLKRLEPLRSAAEREVWRCESNTRRLVQSQGRLRLAEASTSMNEARIAQETELHNVKFTKEHFASLIEWLNEMLAKSAYADSGAIGKP